VRAHAAWALGEIARRSPAPVAAPLRAALERAAAGDPEPQVRAEARAAAGR